jgi:hypothetical protein
MTSKLEEFFNLPQEDTPQDSPQSDNNSHDVIELEAMGSLEKIESALPAVRGLEASDAEMDELADLAKNTYKDLVDLGMNVEARFSAEILSTASNFLGHAITAKTAKINKKLKMIELQLKQAKLEADSGSDPVGTVSGSVLDRNELLEQILKKNEQDKNNKNK